MNNLPLLFPSLISDEGKYFWKLVSTFFVSIFVFLWNCRLYRTNVSTSQPICLSSRIIIFCHCKEKDMKKGKKSEKNIYVYYHFILYILKSVNFYQCYKCLIPIIKISHLDIRLQMINSKLKKERYVLEATYTDKVLWADKLHFLSTDDYFKNLHLHFRKGQQKQKWQIYQNKTISRGLSIKIYKKCWILQENLEVDEMIVR